tara:strand:- start:7532 stop:7699 length:168 start_codon:yes stop_codon:yes gene_type:complete
MTKLEEVLIIRDQLTIDEAQEIIDEMKERVLEGENPDDLLYEIGLEPDYVFDLLD